MTSMDVIKRLTMNKRIRRPILFLVCLGFIWAAFSGCAGLGKRLQAPRVNLADIQVQEVKVLETVLQIEIRVINPNDVPLDIKGIDCELEVNGTTLAAGVSDQKRIIPAYGTTTIPMKVYSSVVDILRGVLGLQNKEKLHYRLKGKISVEGGFMVPSSIPFDSQGEFSFFAP